MDATNNNSNLLGMIILAIIASFPGILSYFSQRKASAGDYISKITESTVTLLEPLNKRIEELEKNLNDVQTQLTIERAKREKLESIVEIWCEGARILREQIQESGQVPKWNLPDEFQER